MLLLTRMTSTSFQYSDISSNDLRLLKPLRFASDELHFAIFRFSRDEAPPYTAVSYAWGDEKLTEKISLNGRILAVTPNLRTCLHYLSMHAEDANWEYIWADAICIDQTNIMERNSQVRLMHRTYKEAVCVSVWLRLPPLTKKQSKSASYIPKLFSGSEAPFSWQDHMAELAGRPYWTRFWVIQEFFLGQDVEIFCGPHRTDFHTFRSIYDGQNGRRGLFSRLAEPLLAGRYLDTLQNRHRRFSLGELLILHRFASCSDPRDRVFCFLALLHKEERENLDRFFPDYGLGEETVVTIAFAHVLGFSRFIVDKHTENMLFVALGVESCETRRRMWDLAGRLNIVEMQPNEILKIIRDAEKKGKHKSSAENDNAGTS